MNRATKKGNNPFIKRKAPVGIMLEILYDK
jgi:hypothetical protein